MICWLASYPKSGNTWLRVFLANWFSEEPIGINDLKKKGLSLQDTAEAYWADYKVAYEVQCKVRPIVLKHIVASRQGTSFVKTHMGNYVIDGVPQVPMDLTDGGIYLVRDPRDVAPSFAKHMNLSAEEAVAALNDENRILLKNDVVQWLSTWSFHVRSWGNFPWFRYEDLKNDPRSGFGEILQTMNLPLDERLDRALERSDLENLKKQEAEEGFRESVNGRFFGNEHEPLCEELRARIESDHGEVMRELGYL